jgi:hypothetical protein
MVQSAGRTRSGGRRRMRGRNRTRYMHGGLHRPGFLKAFMPKSKDFFDQYDNDEKNKPIHFQLALKNQNQNSNDKSALQRYQEEYDAAKQYAYEANRKRHNPQKYISRKNVQSQKKWWQKIGL